MTTILTSTQETSFVHKLSLKYDELSYSPEIIINDLTLSKRQISKISNNLISTINNVEDNQLIYIPIRFDYKKLGDEKHRIILLFSNNTLEVFDCNSWKWMLKCKEYKNKQNLVAILKNVKKATDINIFTYNYSLNCVSGYCTSFGLLFILYRTNGLSINDVCQIFEAYESRTDVHYEKKINKLFKKKEFDWSIYHDIITTLINKEN